jgi:hypothetical protein
MMMHRAGAGFAKTDATAPQRACAIRRDNAALPAAARQRPNGVIRQFQKRRSAQTFYCISLICLIGKKRVYPA